MKKDFRIYVAGHCGLVGSAILQKLITAVHTNLLTRTHAELDLTDQKAVQSFFRTKEPEFVFMAATRVGGMKANSSYPADFIRDNILIQTHILDQAWRNGTQKILFLGSPCI